MVGALVPQAVNVNARKTHCPVGHPYDEANTRRVAHGNGRLRICRACERERTARKRLDPEYRHREKLYALRRRGVPC